MKKPEIKSYNFRKLMEKVIQEEAIFSVPEYQREYSWTNENWERFLESAKELIRYEKEGNIDQTWFIGSIVLQKAKNNNYLVIDGQQRLITIFILLSVISNNEDTISDNSEIKKEITDFLFFNSSKNRIRIELYHSEDRDDYIEAILSNSDHLNYKTQFYLEKKKLLKRERGNIYRANQFFSRKVGEKLVHSGIYQTIMDKFYFSLTIIDQEDDPAEIFMALNTVGTPLTNSDLIRSLFITQSKLQRQERKKVWNKKIEKIVCPTFNKQAKSRMIEEFLINFWEAHSSKCRHVSWDARLYSYYRDETRKNNTEQNENLFNKLVEAADVYSKLVFVEKWEPWWEENWSSEMFYLIYNIHFLGRREFFSLVLSIHFRFQGKDKADKLIIIQDLKKLMIYIFRVININQRKDEKNFLREIRVNLLKKVNDKEKSFNFFEDEIWKKWLEEEFEEENSNEFYRKLIRYEVRGSKEDKIWNFIFQNYYWAKIFPREDINQVAKAKLRKDIIEYNVERLEPLTTEEAKYKSRKNNLWNITLARVVDSSSWHEKRITLKGLGNDFLMNYLEEEKWVDIEDVDELSARREKSLVENFRKLRIFEID